MSYIKGIAKKLPKYSSSGKKEKKVTDGLMDRLKYRRPYTYFSLTKKEQRQYQAFQKEFGDAAKEIRRLVRLVDKGKMPNEEHHEIRQQKDEDLTKLFFAFAAPAIPYTSKEGGALFAYGRGQGVQVMYDFSLPHGLQAHLMYEFQIGEPVLRVKSHISFSSMEPKKSKIALFGPEIVEKILPLYHAEEEFEWKKRPTLQVYVSSIYFAPPHYAEPLIKSVDNAFQKLGKQTLERLIDEMHEERGRLAKTLVKKGVLPSDYLRTGSWGYTINTFFAQGD